eukprot:SAG31_NODE_28035_length_416_cov_0.955836_1_plen_66_part_00
MIRICAILTHFWCRYHPQIDQKEGTICLGLLKDEWSPACTVAKVMDHLMSVMKDPNTGLICEALP